MKRVLDIAVLIALTIAALILAGVINETFVLVYLTLASMPSNTTVETLKQVVEAFAKSDWKGIATIGGGFVQPALFAYFVRSVIYLAVTVVVMLWAVPHLRKAFSSLRQQEDDLDELEAVSIEERRTLISRSLRSRAAKKRIESYTFLTAALVSLAIAIGFVTRDHFSERPEALDEDATATQDAMMKAEDLLTRVQDDRAHEKSEQYAREGEFLDLVRVEVSKMQAGFSPETAKSMQGVLSSLLERPAASRTPDFDNLTAAANNYIDFAKAQLIVVNKQAELEVIFRTVMLVVVKLASVVLILYLAKVLVRLYEGGLELSVQYEGIADALQLRPQDDPSDFAELRGILTPAFARRSSEKLPKHIFEAIRQLIDSQKPIRSRGSSD